MKSLLKICAPFLVYFELVHCQTCSTQQGKDIRGNDYYSVKGQPGDCCRLCYESYYCRAYSWTNHEGGTCFLKQAVSPLVDASGVTVGILNGNNCQRQTDSDIEGQNLRNVREQQNNCCSICAKTKGCSAYSWSDHNGGTCWLKSATGPIVKKRGVTVGILCIGGGCQSEAESAGCGSGWKTVKKYQFASMNQVNKDWDTIVWPAKHVNWEEQAYVNSSANIFLKNNRLVLRAAKLDGQIKSGRLESKIQFSPKNMPGNKLKVEFIAKIPAAMGAWPALWMLGSDGQYGTAWPLNGEIDIMEWVWQMQNKIKVALHWKSPVDWGEDLSDGLDMRKVSTSFHTYGVEYSTVTGDEYVQFYIRKPNGGIIYGTKVKPDLWHDFNGSCKPNCPKMAPFDAKMNLIMNIAVGGAWGSCCGVQNYNIFENGIEMEVASVEVCALR